MVVPEGRVEDVVRCILRKARTGQVGDGRIFILDVGQAIRIRDGEEGEDILE
ncbi:hypothetical protein BH24BAC1_BH24BAC1_28010 [soil metagenome]